MATNRLKVPVACDSFLSHQPTLLPSSLLRALASQDMGISPPPTLHPSLPHTCPALRWRLLGGTRDARCSLAWCSAAEATRCSSAPVTASLLAPSLRSCASHACCGIQTACTGRHAPPVLLTTHALRDRTKAAVCYTSTSKIFEITRQFDVQLSSDLCNV